MTSQAAYGSWPSVIQPEMLVSDSIRIFDVQLVDNQVCWIEMRPSEAGRYVIMRSAVQGGRAREMLRAPYSARTLVHEYGGMPYGVWSNETLFTNFADQGLYRLARGNVTRLFTPEDCRLADFAVNPNARRAYAVREDHSVPNQEPVNTLVMIDLAQKGTQVVVAAGHDFYSSPSLNQQGTRLAWLAWNHPAMPWDETELWVAELDDQGEVIESRCLWSEPGVSLFQPVWSPQGNLHCISDASGWWNLYRLDEDKPVPLYPHEAEYGVPQWVFGLRTYAFVDDTRILCSWKDREGGKLGILQTDTGTLSEIETKYTSFAYVQANAQWAAFLAASPTEFPSLVLLNLETGKTRVLRRSNSLTLDPAQISVPRAIEFDTEGQRTAHAYFYPPTHAEYQGMEGERPPLLLMSHGGPTSATSSALSLSIQYWTNRGIAVVDVNYGGSTGYGTEYRRRLNGMWGVVDVQDCANAARHLVQEGLVDPERLAITGGSAGGFTTLACLAFTNVFHAGISHFGVSDLGALARETHKFESRYLDSMIGPYPAEAALYDQRSPLKSADRIACPVLFLQGLNDKIVLPNQAEMMVEALKGRGIPVAYLPFAGEEHGFRQAHNIMAAIQAETYFLSRLFGFQPADDIAPIPIDNLP